MAKCRVSTSPGVTNKTMGTKTPDTKPAKKWTVFPGKNRFACDGRCICAPDYHAFIFILITIVVTGEYCKSTSGDPPEGGTGGPDPPTGKSQVVWISNRE